MRSLGMKVLCATAGGLAVWAIVVAGMLVFRHALIYPFRDWPDARTVSGLPGAAARTFRTDDGVEVIYWHVAPRQGQPTILCFMGNAGSLPSSAPRLREFALRGFGIAALNYRGAGGAAGHPDQQVLVADALALYDLLGDHRPVIWGTSLGAALAVQLAVRRPVRALILETPFARLCETAEHHYPLIPACLVLPDNRWPSIEVIRDVRAPVLVLHGDADRIIPLSHGKALFAAVPVRRQIIVYPGGRHNDLPLHGAGADIMAFLATLPDD